jgi:hypothetical protein
MPLVQIDLLEGRSEGELDVIPDSVHEAMVAVLDVPRRDRFQIITDTSCGIPALRRALPQHRP